MVKNVLTVVGSAVARGVACNKGYKIIKKRVSGIDKEKATVIGAVVFAAVAALVVFLYNEFVLDVEDKDVLGNDDDEYIDLDKEE